MNEKFRAIGLDTEDKITEFIDYIDDLEDTEEIKSDVYGFFEEESSYNENHIPAYVVMTKYKGKYIVWVEDQCCDFAISYPPYNLSLLYGLLEEAELLLHYQDKLIFPLPVTSLLFLSLIHI